MFFGFNVGKLGSFGVFLYFEFRDFGDFGVKSHNWLRKNWVRFVKSKTQKETLRLPRHFDNLSVNKLGTGPLRVTSPDKSGQVNWVRFAKKAKGKGEKAKVRNRSPPPIYMRARPRLREGKLSRGQASAMGFYFQPSCQRTLRIRTR